MMWLMQTVNGAQIAKNKYAPRQPSIWAMRCIVDMRKYAPRQPSIWAMRCMLDMSKYALGSLVYGR